MIIEIASLGQAQIVTIDTFIMAHNFLLLILKGYNTTHATITKTSHYFSINQRMLRDHRHDNTGQLKHLAEHFNKRVDMFVTK